MKLYQCTVLILNYRSFDKILITSPTGKMICVRFRVENISKELHKLFTEWQNKYNEKFNVELSINIMKELKSLSI